MTGVEACDDGDDDDTDECTSMCTLPSCGDGFVQPDAGEQCEPPNTDVCSAECTTVVPGLVDVELLAEDFDDLPNSPLGSSDAATFQTALAGWALYNSNDGRQVGTGSSLTGGIYSYGAVDAQDRALGGQASQSTGAQGFGVCITNGTLADYQEITVSYVGEQWRDSGNPDAQLLVFSYTTSATLAADLQTGDTVIQAAGADATTEWLEVPGLQFTSPITAGQASALDGNAPDNQTALSLAVPNLVVPPAGVVCMRWVEANDPSSDHGLAIDSLVVTAKTAAP